MGDRNNLEWQPTGGDPADDHHSQGEADTYEDDREEGRVDPA